MIAFSAKESLHKLLGHIVYVFCFVNPDTNWSIV